MRIKPKTQGQKVADTIITQVGKLEGDDLILQLQKYLDEGRGSSLEQILMGRAIAELINLRHWRHHWMGVKEGAGLLHEKIERLEEENIRISEYVPPPVRDEFSSPPGPYTTGTSQLSIENVMKICREDEQNQLAEMLNLQDEANFNNEQFNKANMK